MLLTLYILIFTIVIVPLYSFMDIMTMSIKEFKKVTGVQIDGLCQLVIFKLGFFITENLGLSIFMHNKNQKQDSLRRQHVLNSMTALIRNIF